MILHSPVMQRFVILLISLCCLGSGTTWAGPAKIVKVLPHLLDAQGRHTLAPSLYERDAYQAHLRLHPELVKTLRFNVRWKYSQHYMESIKLRLEVRGSKEPRIQVFEEKAERRSWYQRWSTFNLDEPTYKKLGEIVAWRVTLWDGDRQLAELQSFLW
jgi:hypothetical protein